MMTNFEELYEQAENDFEISIIRMLQALKNAESKGLDMQAFQQVALEYLGED